MPPSLPNPSLDVLSGMRQGAVVKISEPLERGLPEFSVGAVTWADVADVAALMRRTSIAAVGRSDATEDEVRDEFLRPGFDLTRDAALTRDPDGEVVVYVEAFDEHHERAFIDVFIDPSLPSDSFDRAARLALEGAKARLAEALTERGATATIVGAGLYHGEERLLRAYESAGFVRENIYWRMAIDLTDWQPPGQAPPAAEIQGVDPDDDEVLAAALLIRNSEFRGHHGHVDFTLDDFATRVRGSSSYDRSAWWFAYLDGSVVGICLAGEEKADEDAGYIRTLAVVRRARGRGVAKALLRAAFTEYQRRGRTSVQLGVDTANTTGATQLYESVGMKPILAIDSLALTVTAPV